MGSRYQIEASIKDKAVKFLFYGPEGIGKSTLASKLPSVIFIDTEGSTDRMLVCRYPRPRSWDTLLDMVDDAGQIKIKTLVIDTADWAERLCVDALCAAKGWKGIEDAGYGKGYVYLREKFGALLDKLTDLQEKGINVGFCAHAQLRKVERPEETGAYDHWELKVSKQVGPMLKEWADLLLFCNYKTMVIHGATPMEKNKIAGGKRVMYTTHNPVWDAKNRFGLPEELPLDYEGIRSVFEPEPKPAPEPIFIPLGTGKAPSPARGDPDEDAAAVPGPQAAPTDSREEGQPAEAEYPQRSDGDLPEHPFTGETEGPVFPEEPEPEAARKDKAGSDMAPTQLADRYPDLAQLMDAAGILYEEVQAAVSARGYFPGDMPIELYPKEFVKGCLVAAWDTVKNLIMDMRRKNNG